jgi:hypothetical protein
MMTNKRSALALIVLVALAAILHAEEADRSGHILFQVGAGLGRPAYPSADQAIIDDVATRLGVTRIRMALALSVGVGLSQKNYILLGAEGIGDRLDDSLSYAQINTYLYYLGARYYPGVTGFYLQAMLGATSMVLQSSDLYSPLASEIGSGVGAAIGYDSAPQARGFGLCIELSGKALEIEGDFVYTTALTANLCWK